MSKDDRQEHRFGKRNSTGNSNSNSNSNVTKESTAARTKRRELEKQARSFTAVQKQIKLLSHDETNALKQELWEELEEHKSKISLDQLILYYETIDRDYVPLWDKFNTNQNETNTKKNIDESTDDDSKSGQEKTNANKHKGNKQNNDSKSDQEKTHKSKNKNKTKSKNKNTKKPRHQQGNINDDWSTSSESSSGYEISLPVCFNTYFDTYFNTYFNTCFNTYFSQFNARMNNLRSSN